MTLAYLRRSLLLAALALSLSLPAAAQDAEPQGEEAPVPPPSPRADDAAPAPDATEAAAAEAAAGALVGAGRFEEAIVALRPLLEQETIEPNALFLYGLASLEASQRPDRPDEEREVLLDEAIAAFHVMLVQRPDLVRVRLELAPRELVLPLEEERARQRWIGTLPDSRELGARLEVARRLTARVTVHANASWHDRRYRMREHLNGPVWDASLRGSWVVTPTVRANLSAGYAQERPERARERNESRWLGAGVTVALPLGFTVGGGGEMRWTDFEDEWFPNTPVGEDRADRTRSVRLSVHNRGLTVFGFSPAIVAVHEERDTNAQAYDYTRTRGELRFVQQF